MKASLILGIAATLLFAAPTAAFVAGNEAEQSEDSIDKAPSSRP